MKVHWFKAEHALRQHHGHTIMFHLTECKMAVEYYLKRIFRISSPTTHKLNPRDARDKVNSGFPPSQQLAIQYSQVPISQSPRPLPNIIMDVC